MGEGRLNSDLQLSNRNDLNEIEFKWENVKY